MAGANSFSFTTSLYMTKPADLPKLLKKQKTARKKKIRTKLEVLKHAPKRRLDGTFDPNDTTDIEAEKARLEKVRQAKVELKALKKRTRFVVSLRKKANKQIAKKKRTASKSTQPVGNTGYVRATSMAIPASGSKQIWNGSVPGISITNKGVNVAPVAVPVVVAAAVVITPFHFAGSMVSPYTAQNAFVRQKTYEAAGGGLSGIKAVFGLKQDKKHMPYTGGVGGNTYTGATAIAVEKQRQMDAENMTLRMRMLGTLFGAQPDYSRSPVNLMSPPNASGNFFNMVDSFQGFMNETLTWLSHTP
jgi:hypothetical protein